MDNINFIEEEECPEHAKCYNIPDFKDIYHGCMSRELAVRILKATGENNSYLIRKRLNPEEDDNNLEYILSFLNNDDDYHFKIRKDKKYYNLGNKFFPTFKCLISRYKTSPIIQDSCLQYEVKDKSLVAFRESLRDQICYLAESPSNEKLKDLLLKHDPGSYLFRPRTDDNDQFVLMFFDGVRIHKIKMNLCLLQRQQSQQNNTVRPTRIADDGQAEKVHQNGDSSCHEVSKNNNGNQEAAVVVLNLGQNYFETWQELVDTYTENPIVPVVGAGAQHKDRLVTAVNVNAAVESIELDIYRQIKFNRATVAKDVYSVHGEVYLYEGGKKKWKLMYGSVDKDHGQLLLKNGKQQTTVLELIKCSFIPIHFSVFQKFCFILEQKDQKVSYIAMVPPLTCGGGNSSFDHREMSEDAYCYRRLTALEHDSELYHGSETDSEAGQMLSRAYERWMMAVKRHCINTKDDVANEENPERHAKLYRYSRWIKLIIDHNYGSDINLTDADLISPVSSALQAVPGGFGITASGVGGAAAAGNSGQTGGTPAVGGLAGLGLSSISISQSSHGQMAPTSPNGQFELMCRSGRHILAVIMRQLDIQGPRTYFFRDLPSDINDLSVNFRMKGPKRKEYLKELCRFTMIHQVLVPSAFRKSSQQLQPFVGQQQQQQQQDWCELSSISADPPSVSGATTIQCNVNIEYTESVILPFINYRPLSKYIMENLELIFSYEHFFKSSVAAVELDEYRKLLSCFLSMSIWEKKQIEFLYLFLEREIKGNNPDMYFRTNNLPVRLLSEYVQQFADEWRLLTFVRFFEQVFLTTDVLAPLEVSAGSPMANAGPGSGVTACSGQTGSAITAPGGVMSGGSGAVASSSGGAAAVAAAAVSFGQGTCHGGVSTVVVASEETSTADNGDFWETMSEDMRHKCLKALLDGVKLMLPHCPVSLRLLLHKLQQLIQQLNQHTTPVASSSDDPESAAAASASNTTGSGAKYRLITNFVILRFFCVIMTSPGTKRDEFLCRVVEHIRRSDRPELARFPSNLQNPLVYNFLHCVSKRVIQVYASTSNQRGSGESQATRSFIVKCRNEYLPSLNSELTRSLTASEENELVKRLEVESEQVCRNFSLSRRFNEVLEFVTHLHSSPGSFLSSSPSSGADLAEYPCWLRLWEIAEQINSKKS